MIACTSISPSHINKDIQARAISSWISLGMKVYSFNCESEIEALKAQYDYVEFVPTNRTMQLTYGKPLVNISAVLDWCMQQEPNEFCLINSDIELNCDEALIERVHTRMADSILLCNRTDYTESYDTNMHSYLLGIDVFFIHKKWMINFPQSMHCFGMTFWDYFVPYTAIRCGINVIFLEQKIAFHKAHVQQYSQDNWRKSGRFFLWEQGLYQFDDIRGIGDMSTHVYNFIYNASRRLMI